MRNFVRENVVRRIKEILQAEVKRAIKIKPYDELSIDRINYEVEMMQKTQITLEDDDINLYDDEEDYITGKSLKLNSP